MLILHSVDCTFCVWRPTRSGCLVYRKSHWACITCISFWSSDSWCFGILYRAFVLALPGLFLVLFSFFLKLFHRYVLLSCYCIRFLPNEIKILDVLNCFRQHENCCSIIRDREVVDRLKSIPSKFPLDGNISRIVDLVVDRIESHVLGAYFLFFCFFSCRFSFSIVFTLSRHVCWSYLIDSTHHLLLQHKEHIYGLTGSNLKSVLGPLSPSR